MTVVDISVYSDPRNEVAPLFPNSKTLYRRDLESYLTRAKNNIIPLVELKPT